MLRRKGERFNPYGDWEDQDAVYELLEDVETGHVPGRVARAVCLVEGHEAPEVGAKVSWYVDDGMFAPLPRTGRLAP